MGVEEENGITKRPLTGINIEDLDKIQRDMIGFNNKIEPYYMPRVATRDRWEVYPDYMGTCWN